jgi:cobalt-zinc-cadmium efflux system outer membrane protein
MLTIIARRGGMCLCLWALSTIAGAQTESRVPLRVLGMTEALARTVARNPELMVLGYQREALEGALTQASLPPNPELGVALQDVLGTGINRGVDNAETTVSLAWVLERGVRERRIDAARAGVDLGVADAEIMHLDLGAETARRFVLCLAYQARLEWAHDAVALARETIAAVGERVSAGRAPTAELARAEAELARTELVEEDYEHELLSALHRLSAQWGETEPDFDVVAGNVMRLPVLEPFEAISARMSQNPDLARYASQERLDAAELALAQAQARPPWQLSGGLRRIESTDDFALVGGISIPLAVRNRNEGRIAAARANLARTAAARAAAEIRIETMLFTLHQELNHYLQTARRLREDIVPRLEQALIETRRAFELGRYSYLEWRAVQGELLQANEALLESSIDAHGIAIEIERLTGVALAPAVTAQ